MSRSLVVISAISISTSASAAKARAATPQLVQLEASSAPTELLQISFRGAELKLPAGVDIDAVAALLRSIQSL